MRILVTVCARGGSKGVKNKNIRKLCDKPLIAYTIGQAIEWGKAEDIVVSTDSTDIASVAKSCGAQVPFLRPAGLANDDTPKLPVIRHALFACERLYSKTYDIIVDLDATAPLRQKKDLDSCLRLFTARTALTLVSVVPAHRNPYFNMVEESLDGFVHLCKTIEGGVASRQKAPIVYDMNASIYFYRREYLANELNTSPLSKATVAYVMDEISRYDVDSEVDFRHLEYILREGLFTLR
jgi:CMP-N-acetylneuraminic acid synthetase